MDYRERGFHGRGVYPKQYTSRMGTVRVKQEEEAGIMQESIKNYRKIKRKHEGEKSQTRPN